MNRDTCPKCGGPLKCLAGHSAHPDNWYCVDESTCGWNAWEDRQPTPIEKMFPLFPELSEQGKEEAQKLIDNFRERIKKVIYEELDGVIGKVYQDVSTYIESDSWMNFRRHIVSGITNYNNRSTQAEYDFKKIRDSIYNEFREEIIKDLDQDNLKRIAELEDSLKQCERRLHGG